MTNTERLAEALRYIENAATDLRVQRYEIRAAATEALAAHDAEQAQQFDDLDLALIRKLRSCAWAVAKGDPVRDYLDEDDVVDSVRLLLQVIGPNVEGLITKDSADFDTWFGVVQSEVMKRVGFDYQSKDAARAEYEDGYPANFLADDIAEEEESKRNLDDARAAYAARMACMPWRTTK